MIMARYHDIAPVCLKGLKEFDFGSLDGKCFDEYEASIQPHRIADDWTDVGGENVELFRKRSDEAFEKILSVCRNGETVMVVSHGSFFMHLMKTIFDYDQQDYIRRTRAQNKPFIPNAGIAEFCYEDGKYTLTKEPVTADEYRSQQERHLKFTYVCHGETIFQKQGMLEGWCDSPMTETGIAQCEEMKRKLAGIRFDACLCSTTERTRDTASLLCDIPAVYDKRLREVFYGKYEASYVKDIEEQTGCRKEELNKNGFGGESEEEIRRRIREFFRDVTDACSDENILIVSHPVLYRYIAGYLGFDDRVSCPEIRCWEYRNGKYENLRKM
jgi:broad specificity phosphatase PhoE